MKPLKLAAVLAGLAALTQAVPGADARAGLVSITVTNTQAAGGYGLTPVWLGLSDGSYSSFGAGSNLNGTPLEALAELGNTAPLMAAFAPLGPQITIGSGPILPTSTATGLLDVSNPGTTRFLHYASMLIPSNDFFFGNPSGAPIALFNASGQLIDAQGQLTATRTLAISGSQIWDAGTEVNAINAGGAFVSGVDAMGGTAENGTAQLVFGGPADNSAYLASLVGVNTPAGYTINRALSPDDPIATITFTAVPEPSPFWLAGMGATLLGGASYARSRRRRGRSA